jgi:hypothetical protein
MARRQHHQSFHIDIPAPHIDIPHIDLIPVHIDHDDGLVLHFDGPPPHIDLPWHIDIPCASPKRRTRTK